MRRALLLFLIAGSCWAQVEYSATADSIELHYDAPDSGVCSVEASVNPEMHPLVAAVDPDLAPAAQMDKDAGRRRTFVLGQRTGLLAAGRLIPMWLEPDTTYYVRIRCGERQLYGVAKTEPAGRNADGNCIYRLSAASGTFPAAGGAYVLSLNTLAGCVWYASTGASWLRVSPTQGVGSASIALVVDANTGAQRYGSVWVADGGISVTQQAGSAQPAEPCDVSFYSSGSWYPATGGWYQMDVLAPAGCFWQVQSSSSWMRITTASSGFGRATIGYTVDRNTGALRSGGLWVGGRSFTVNQLGGAAPVCTPTLSSYNSWFPAAGGTYSVSVYIQPDCTWTASSALPWVNIRSGNGATGPAAVTIVMDANPYSTTRTGTIKLAGIDFHITQTRGADNLPPDCTVTLGGSANVPFDAAPHAVLVGVPAGCSWTASTTSPWIRLTTASGTGSGTVGYSVDANTGAERTGSIVVGGKTFTVQQAALSCSFRLSFLNSWFPSTGATYSVGVNTPVGCAWAAASGASWLRLTGATAGSGPGLVQFTLDTNWSSARTTTILAGGQTAVVNQSSGYVPPESCAVSLNLTSSWFPTDGGSYALDLGSPANCAWTASTNVSWIRLNTTSGTGPATLRYTMEANTGSYRTASIQVGGRTFTVHQAALYCTYRVNFNSSWFPGAAATYSIAVTTPAGCPWTATPGADWIRFTGASTGSGSATVPFALTANPGRLRSAVMYVAGQPVQIWQVGQ